MHAQHKRYVTHVSHLELARQLSLDRLDHHDVATDHDTIVHVKRENDDDTVVVVDVDAGIRLERSTFDYDKDGIEGVKPVPGALS